MEDEQTYSLRGFAALLGEIAEDYNIKAKDVLLLLQTHADECSSFFKQGESYANSINGKLSNAIDNELKELNEKSSEDNKDSGEKPTEG